MSSEDGILHCVLKKEWFDKIKSGEKTHEYREVKPSWESRILEKEGRELWGHKIRCAKVNKVRFSLGMTKAPDKVMLFEILGIFVVDGLETDLKIDKKVFDIALGRRLQ